MRRPLAIAAVSLLAALAAFAPRASSRQLRVDLAGFSFTPDVATLNQGDHVVWVWTGGTHSVVSGAPGTETGVFDSGLFGTNQTFSWKADRTGTIDYYCGFHGAAMSGTLTLVSSGATAGLSDFRITEVQYNVAGGADLVEITNLGASGDLGKYRLKVSGATVATLAPAVGASIPLAAGARMRIHVGQAGTNTSTDLFVNVGGLPDAAGSVALYVPNTQITALNVPSQIVDYVSWGSGGQENEGTATSASLWNTSTTVPLVAAGHSMEFCGQPGQYGTTRWYDNPNPNFGAADNCLTPTLTTTWGRLKTLYR